MGDETTLVVNVSDLVGRDEMDLNIEEILMSNIVPATLKPDVNNALHFAVSESWRSKAYADVEVLCGVDDGVILTHRLVLASLSPYLKKVLQADPEECQHERTCLLLPDVDSVVLSSFLTKVCLGLQEVAITDPSLTYLQFQCRTFYVNTKQELDDFEGPVEDDAYDESIETTEFEDNKFGGAVGGGRRRSQVWKFFKRIDPATAKCKTCSNVIRTINGNTTGLGRHMRSVHPDLYEANDMCFQLGNSREPEGPNKRTKKRSTTWNYFEKLDGTNAVCTLCNSVIKTEASNTTGMVRHLKRFHLGVCHDMAAELRTFNEWPRDSSSPMDLAFEETDPINVASESLEGSPPKRRSKVWTFFDKIDKTNAKCLHCNRVIKTEAGNTSGMTRHLSKHHHGIWIRNADDQPAVETFILPSIIDATSFNDDSQSKLHTRKRSLVWNHFIFQSKDSAICSQCNAVVKTLNGNTTGLNRHMSRQHPEVWSTIANTDESLAAEDPDEMSENNPCTEPADDVESDDEVSKGKHRSPIWRNFRRGGDKLFAICKICNANVRTSCGNTTGMTRHLQRSHPIEFEQFESDKLSDRKKLTTIKEEEREEEEEVKSVPTIPLDVWKYYENINTETITDENQSEDMGNNVSAGCILCKAEIHFSQDNLDPLEGHLRQEHQSEFEETGDDNSNQKGMRSGVWKYFKKTNDKTKNICLTCGNVMLCTKQNTTSMIRHLDRKHPDLYIKYLEEIGTPSEEIEKTLQRQKTRSIKDEIPSDPSNRTCPDCNKLFWHKRAMLYHKKVVHSGERPFKCAECGLSFARQECYTKHTHIVEYKFLCSHCGKTFGRKSARDLHERAHRGDRRYSCSFCEKTFMTNQALAKHERIHKGEKPFRCLECGRSFVQQHQLTTHLRIHTGEKPYNCDFCDQTFRHLSSKNKHKCDTRNLNQTKWNFTEVLTGHAILQDEESMITTAVD